MAKFEDPVVISFPLRDQMFQRLNSEFEKNTEKRAEEIAIAYIKKDKRVTDVVRIQNGADLLIRYIDGRNEEIEIKGTKDTKIAWYKLKVSSVANYEKIVAGMKIYRICGVYEKEPSVSIVEHGEHFELVEEPRWRIARKQDV